VVTGAGRGIGAVVSQALARAGADVAVIDVNKEDALRTAETISKIPAASLAVPADVTREEEIEEANRLIIENFGRIDILFNNAGVQVIGPAEDMSLADWRKVLEVNLSGMFLCCRVFAGDMIKRRAGKIINMASIHGLTASGLHSAVSYNVSKAGVVNLTRSLATEWGRYGLNVNAIAPGMIKTEMTEKRLNDPVHHQKVIDRVALKRIFTPSDLVGAVIFLASRASDMITGQTIVIDGGWLCHS
jgi:2-deoxy-D-gluconate 3-dehydrogenase